MIEFGRNKNQIDHTFRHTDAEGLFRIEVEAAVLSRLRSVESGLRNGPYTGDVRVRGFSLSSVPISSATATSTSDVSQSVHSDPRLLTPKESALLKALLEMIPEGAALRGTLPDAHVVDMADGAMGSLRFTDFGSRRMGREAIAAEALDEDGVPLEISVNLDEDGNLFELDIWKVDYSPLKRLPEPAQVKRV